VDLDEILYGDNDIEGYLGTILLYHVESTIKNGGRLNFCGGATYEMIGGSG
jgi:hypothetical protein